MTVCCPGWTTSTTDSRLKRIISTNFCIHRVVPPDDGPRYARNAQRLTKYTKNKLCIKLVFLYTVVTILRILRSIQSQKTAYLTCTAPETLNHATLQFQLCNVHKKRKHGQAFFCSKFVKNLMCNMLNFGRQLLFSCRKMLREKKQHDEVALIKNLIRLLTLRVQKLSGSFKWSSSHDDFFQDDREAIHVAFLCSWATRHDCGRDKFWGYPEKL